jgi:hypothetical protein
LTSPKGFIASAFADIIFNSDTLSSLALTGGGGGVLQ